MAKAVEKRENSEEEFTQSNNSSSGRNIFKNRQTTINNMFKKGLREEACQTITRFFYNNAIPFNVAKSVAMFDLVSRHGL